MPPSINDRIRDVLARHGKLVVDPYTIADDADLYEAGLTSHASVNVMLGVEDAFDLEFPDAKLRKETFASIGALTSVVYSIQS